MAQEKKPDTEKQDSKFHYYSGGEIKEQAGTGVSPVLWIFWTIVIVAAVVGGILSGALGPKVRAFRAPDSSSASLNVIQQQLNGREANGALRYASVNLNDLPIPGGETIDQAVVKGTDVYQTYCIGCHGPNQDGNGVNASSLNPKPRNLRDAPFMQGMSYQRITTSLHKGVPGTAMPRWENTLTEAEIGNVIAYVFSLTSPAAPVSVNPAASGGSKQYVSGTQSSPKPITPAIGGNPAAATNTAPPSQSGPTPDEVKAQLGNLNNADNQNGTGPAAAPIVMPKPGAPVPGSTTPNGMSGAGTAPSSANGM